MRTVAGFACILDGNAEMLEKISGLNRERLNAARCRRLWNLQYDYEDCLGQMALARLDIYPSTYLGLQLLLLYKRCWADHGWMRKLVEEICSG